MTTKRSDVEKHFFRNIGEAISSDDGGMGRFNREAAKADAKFAEAMVAAGYTPEVKTGHQGSQPMRVGPGMMSPGIRSNANF